MNLISVGFLQNSVMEQYGRHPELRVKIEKFFINFPDNYADFNYVWYEDRLFIEAQHSDLVRTDIGNLLERQIDVFVAKSFSPSYSVKFVDNNVIKQKLEERRQKRLKDQQDKKQKIKDDFDTIIHNIRNGVEGHRLIGTFDLEFWELNNNIILEFGWRIEDYKTGTGKTVHLIIQENIGYSNTRFSKNNRFSRKDSDIVSLQVAKERFKEEFLDVVELFIGHGSNNDIKVLKANGVQVEKVHIDTSVIGGMLINNSINAAMVSLTKLSNFYRVRHGELHNAANDVECISKVFFSMGDL